jgi:hypothetical protein
MPLTVLVPVVPGEARTAPPSIGMPSKPICALVDCDAEEVAVVDAAPELELFDELLLPQPARATTTAAITKKGKNRRISCRTVPGDNLRRR